MRDTKVARPNRLKAVWRAAFGLMDNGLPRLEPSIGGKSGSAGGTAAGKVVTPQTSMELSPTWSCVRLISETQGTLPLVTYATDANGGRTVAYDEPLYGLLHDSPHADFTAVEFWEGVALSLCLRGNSYARKEFVGDRLVALTPLNTDLMSVRRNQAGALEYAYSDPKGFRLYRQEEIFHVRGFGGAGDVGLSPIAYARQSLSTAMAAEELAGSIFKNGARISGALTVDQTLDPDQRKQAQDNIIAPMTGSGNAGGIILLEAGFKFVPMVLTPEDNQFLQTREFHVEEQCRWYRVPPSLVGHTEKSSSLPTAWEGQMIAFNTLCLRPYSTRIEQAIRKQLMTPAQRLRLKAEFNMEGLLRGDSVSRAKFYEIMVRNGLKTRNEVRKLENDPPDPDGDKLTIQMQNVPLAQSDNQPPKEGE